MEEGRPTTGSTSCHHNSASFPVCNGAGSSGPSACRLTLEDTTFSLTSSYLWPSVSAVMRVGPAQRSLP